MPGHHGIGMTGEFADDITAHPLFQEVDDEGTASGIQVIHWESHPPGPQFFRTVFTTTQRRSDQLQHWSQYAVQLMSRMH